MILVFLGIRAVRFDVSGLSAPKTHLLGVIVLGIALFVQRQPVIACNSLLLLFLEFASPL